jgi:hypothetical protein
MASEEPAVPETGELPATATVPRRPRPPFYKDPLSIVGWGLALAAVLAYWYFFVRRPVPQPGEQVARFSLVEGRVRVKPNALEVWKDAVLQDLLHVGDVVQTERASGAKISFNSGSTLGVKPSSIVYLGGSAELSTAAWRVESGNVDFSVGGQVTEIVSPNLTTTAQRNTRGSIDIGEAGVTGVKVYAGQAKVETSRGEVVTLGQNEAVQVDARGQAGEKQQLPPPPKLLAPEIRATIPFAAPPEATAELSWEAVINGDTYHVALDYNVAQAELLIAATLDVPGIRETTHALEGLDPGRYFWRVAAVNESGLEGEFSRVSFFSVEPLPKAAPVVVPRPVLDVPFLTLAEVVEVAPGILHVRGTAAPGSDVSVDGYPVKLLPDGSFSEHVRRTNRGEITVRATSSGGQFAERTRPVPSARP